MGNADLGGIERYIEGLFGEPDPALEETLRSAREAGLPDIQISANQGRFLRLLAEMGGSRRILEIGTLGGYSTIHLARALPESGRLLTLEVNERHAEVARENLRRAGLSQKVEVRVGDAKRTLQKMAKNGEGPFDFVFIDAEKEGYSRYLDLSLALSRAGTVIVADNTIRGGAVLDPDDSSSRAVRLFNERFAADERLDGTILPVIRERVDGITLGRVR